MLLFLRKITCKMASTVILIISFCVFIQYPYCFAGVKLMPDFDCGRTLVKTLEIRRLLSYLLVLLGFEPSGFD